MPTEESLVAAFAKTGILGMLFKYICPSLPAPLLFPAERFISPALSVPTLFPACKFMSPPRPFTVPKPAFKTTSPPLTSVEEYELPATICMLPVSGSVSLPSPFPEFPAKIETHPACPSSPELPASKVIDPPSLSPYPFDPDPPFIVTDPASLLFAAPASPPEIKTSPAFAS